MAEKKLVEVDETRLIQLMATDVPLYTAQTGEVENKPDDVMESETVEPVKSTKRKNTRQIDFEGIFLKEAKIKDRRQVYISGEFYEKISTYLRIISEGKVSMVGYIHNVLAYHMLEFKDMINEMYHSKFDKSNPL